MSIGWWLVENPLLGGVLKVCRLKARTGGGLRDLFGQAVPCSIASSSLVVDQDDGDDDDIVALGGCSLCGERRLKHWNESDVTQSEKDVSMRYRSILSALDGESKALKIARHRMETSVSSNNATIATTHSAGEVIDKRAKRKEASVVREHHSSAHRGGGVKPSAAKKKRRSVLTTDNRETSSDSVGAENVFLDEECTGDEAALPPSAAVAMDDLAPKEPSSRALDHGDVETCAATDDDGLSAEGVCEFADHNQSTHSDGATSDVNKLIAELNKLQAENAQLRGEIEITMRKADRRFELELVSRRAWNREREVLEARIEELQRSHMVLTAELASRNRLQEALREMLSTA